MEEVPLRQKALGMTGAARTVLCLGDSLTYGQVGYSYLDFMKTPDRFINRGRNGDTVQGAAARLTRYIASPRYAAVTTCIVGIGTNDTLWPTLARRSAFWARYVAARAGAPVAGRDTDFRAAYERIVTQARVAGWDLIVIGLPATELTWLPTETLAPRDALIREIARTHALPYVDQRAAMAAAALRFREAHPGASLRPYDWSGHNAARIGDALAMSILPPSKDWFARRRQLILSVDGVHHSSLAARAVAAAGAECLRERS
ncbi:MAG: SGNH/GDSL hydrolase family protein [Tetrasphaera sp.]